MEHLSGARQQRNAEPYRVLVTIGNEQDPEMLLPSACAIARSHNGEVRVLTVTRRGIPSWLTIPDTCDDLPTEVVTRAGRNAGTVILAETRSYDPDLLLLGLSGL